MSADRSWDRLTLMVRTYIRDHHELNRLLSGQETSNRTIQLGARMALDEWNARSPVPFQTPAQFPSLTLLIQMTAIHVLTSAGIHYSRNRLPFSEGQFRADTERAADEYPKWIQFFRQSVEVMMASLIPRLNIESAWGARGVSSEYALFSATWYDWN